MSYRRSLHHATDCQAFTLIEMVVSLLILSIVFLAMGSVMMLSAKAMPRPDAPSSLAMDAAEVVEQIVEEIQVAKKITSYNDKKVIFTVADRDDDGNNEVISYAWSGNAGDDLVRTYNGVTSTILSGVQSFSLSYDAFIDTEQGDPVTSNEVVLASYDPASSPADFTVSLSEWIGQYIVPENLPADTISWDVTRVLIKAKVSITASGISSIQLREPDTNNSNIPTSTVLEEHNLLETDLDYSYNWYSFSFDYVTGRLPDEGVCLVIQWIYNLNPCDVQYDMSGGSGYLRTGNGGGTWSINDSKSMVYYLYGTYTTPGTTTPVTRMRGVDIALNTGKDSTTQVNVAVEILNQPKTQ